MAHFCVVVRPEVNDSSFVKVVLHRDAPGRPWALIALGAALYPAGTDLTGRWSA